MPDRVQDATANGTTGEDEPKPTRTRPTSNRSSRQTKAKRFERGNGGQADQRNLTPQALLERLEHQSEELGGLRSQLEEAQKALEQERRSSQADHAALADERRGRERLEAALKREQAARKQAEEALEDSRATATALEAQHHLLRAQLKALEHKKRGLLRRR
jgi:chromosome segregation ATPase